MPSAEYDLRYLRAGLELLEDYLLSSDIYWPIGITARSGETPYPRFTLGGMLLAHTRVHACELNEGQAADLSSIDEQMDALRSRWRVAWEQKASHEFQSRLNLWSSFLDEYRVDPAGNYDRYAYEVSRRVQLQLLKPYVSTVPAAEIDLLTGLDRVLRAVFIPDEFIWDPELVKVFPKDTYWYLYGRVSPD